MFEGVRRAKALRTPFCVFHMAVGMCSGGRDRNFVYREFVSNRRLSEDGFPRIGRCGGYICQSRRCAASVRAPVKNSPIAQGEEGLLDADRSLHSSILQGNLRDKPLDRHTDHAFRAIIWMTASVPPSSEITMSSRCMM